MDRQYYQRNWKTVRERVEVEKDDVIPGPDVFM